MSPHTIRHTTATHLLRAGVDINTIRAWLGHVSLTTTNVYAEVDLEMKAKALANCEVAAQTRGRPWREDAWADGVPADALGADFWGQSARSSRRNGACGFSGEPVRLCTTGFGF